MQQLIQTSTEFMPFPLLPNPLSEIEYWKRRNEDLQQVLSQLETPSLL